AALFNYTEAFTPARFHEALNHLSQVRILTAEMSAVAPPVIEQARQAQQRLLRIGEIFGWSRLRWAARYSREEGEDLLQTLDEYMEKMAEMSLEHFPMMKIHPIELIWAAKYIKSIARTIYADVSQQKRVIELNLRSEHLLNEAYNACDLLHWSKFGGTNE